MKFGFLIKHFPPEKFLDPPRIGISFSDSNIKAIYFDKEVENPQLQSAVLPLEKGAIVNGSISNINEVVKKLSLIKRDFKSPFTFFTLPDELAYVFTSSIAVADGSNATESVAFIIEENVPTALVDTVFDFIPTKIEKTENGYDAEVVVAASLKKEINKFLEAMRLSGFEPLGCIHESQAIANSLLPEKAPGLICIVHARENRIGIYLVRDGLVVFSTLRSIIGDDYKKEFLDEYERFLEYCNKNYSKGDEPIKSALVCGDFEYAKRVVEMLTDQGDVKDVKLSNVWTDVFEIDKHLPGMPYEQSLSFAGPIGAVLSEIE